MLVNPFSARSGVDPKIFVGRSTELKFFRKRLSLALGGRCQHYAITGAWGVGKTVLLRQIKQLAQKKGAWALLFSARRFGSDEGLADFSQHILQMMASELPIQSRRGGKKVQNIGGGALGFSFQVGWSSEQNDKDPQLMLRDGFDEIYKHAKKHGAKLIVVLIDDVQNFAPGDQEFTLLRNVLTDPKIIDDARILVILSSIQQGLDPFLIRDHPVGRLFMPSSPLGYFGSEETVKLIDDSLVGSGVYFHADVKERIFEVTRGHVFEVQALCEALFDQQIKGKVSMSNWDTALDHTLISLADAQFKGMAERASDAELRALKFVAISGESVSPKGLKDSNQNFRNPGEVLKRLAEKGLVDRIQRGAYQVTDRLFAEYLKRI